MARLREILFSLFFLVPTTGFCGAVLDLNLVGSMMNMGTATTRNNTSYLSRAGIYMSPLSGMPLYIGVGMVMVNNTVKVSSTTETYTTTDFNFGIKWSVLRSNTFWVGVSGSPYSQGVFKSTGSTTETWSGVSGVASMTLYYPPKSMDKGLLIGLSLDYYQAQFSKKSTGSTIVSSNQSVTGFYPSISIAYLW